jgi:hypothetical protein
VKIEDVGERYLIVMRRQESGRVASLVIGRRACVETGGRKDGIKDVLKEGRHFESSAVFDISEFSFRKYFGKRWLALHMVHKKCAHFQMFDFDLGYLRI